MLAPPKVQKPHFSILCTEGDSTPWTGLDEAGFLAIRGRIHIRYMRSMAATLHWGWTFAAPPERVERGYDGLTVFVGPVQPSLGGGSGQAPVSAIADVSMAGTLPGELSLEEAIDEGSFFGSWQMTAPQPVGPTEPIDASPPTSMPDPDEDTICVICMDCHAEWVWAACNHHRPLVCCGCRTLTMERLAKGKRKVHMGAPSPCVYCREESPLRRWDGAHM